MADIIRLLPDSVANQIAAGEVIQRPASVVKELVENSVDAGSTCISVIVTEGGKNSIQVIDNGCGMSETDARMAFERHATSKIQEAADLFEIRTKGFRGEALASIAAIATVTLHTRKTENELGTEIQINGSNVEIQGPVSCPAGSNFTVNNLFFNVPARRKFLKNTNTEFRHITEEFIRIALSHPDLEFKLINNGTPVYNLPVVNLKQRITHLFGRSVNASLIPFESETSIVKIKGYIGKPEFAKKKFGEQYFFVNNRYMRHPYFHRAVMKAYEQLLPPDAVPSYFIYLESDPQNIDVNIHPTKTEIKFEDEQAIFQIIKASVKEAIGKTNLAPSIDFDNESSFDIPYIRKNSQVKIPGITVNPDYNPFDSETDKRPSGDSTFKSRQNSNLPDWEKLYEGTGGKEMQPENTSSNLNSQQQVFGQMDFTQHSSFLQLKNRYIFTPVKSGMMVVDQKRAYERIIYERLVHSLAHNFAIAQQTLFPETIQLTPADYSLLNEIFDDLCTIGFDISNFGNNTIVVNGCPSDIRNPEPARLIESVLEEYRNTQGDIKKNARERVARCVARSSAVGYNIPLSVSEMQEVIDQLFGCENPNYSPTGKKIIFILDMQELEKKLN
ncbi:MAG: DNA mismatch repair endonuclease MutL [Bacteroidales bacterium]|nr:DNA mismatch repair endonuclease MutL [Bacteroidales bacterium]